MTVIYIMLCVILYFFIGGIIAGVIHDEDMDAAAIFAWPIIVIVSLAILCFEAVKGLGYTLADIFSHFIREGEQNNEKENN